MFRFANNELFWLFWFVAVACALYFIAVHLKGKSFEKFGNPDLLKQLMPNSSIIKPFVSFLFLLIALIMVIFAAARPQQGTRLEEIKRQGVEIIIALDISSSMLAEDIKPNRLERAKQAIQMMTDKLMNDKIGLIVFAGKSFVQVPVTTDYAITKMMTANVTTETVPVQGTAIGSAISLAVNSFSNTKGNSKVLIIISDGENHEDNPVDVAKSAADAEIIIHTIGIGDPRGAPVPLEGRGGQKNFLKDSEGNIVMTRLDETTLKQIASVGSGMYVRATGTDLGLNKILNEISGMEKTGYESKVFTDYEDKFQYFVGIAAFFVFFGLFISERKSRIFEKLKF